MQNPVYFLALNEVKGLGPNRLKLLIDYLGDPKAVWEDNLTELQKPKQSHPLDTALTETEKLTFNHLRQSSNFIDQWCREHKIVAAHFSVILIKLGILGIVKNLGRGQNATVI